MVNTYVPVTNQMINTDVVATVHMVSSRILLN